MKSKILGNCIIGFCAFLLLGCMACANSKKADSGSKEAIETDMIYVAIILQPDLRLLEPRYTTSVPT